MKNVSVVFGLVLILFVSQESFAQRKRLMNRAGRERREALSDKSHGKPRVNQVSNRQANEDNQIRNGLRTGDLSKKEARGDLRDERRIENQKHRMMKADGGHLTVADQKKLNHELNAEEKKIKNQESH